MLVASGSYTGNGSSQTIAVGFQPDVVLVKHITGTEACVVRTSTMAANNSKRMALAAIDTSGYIETFTETGFTVGALAEVNSNAQSFMWVAWQADADDLAVFTYTGDGNDNTSVGTLGFTPNMAWVLPEAAVRPMWRTDQMAGDLSQRFDAAATTNNIQALQAGSIQVGTALNANGGVYHAICWKTAAETFALTEYEGDGNDNRNIAHGLGATPVFTLIEPQNTSGAAAARFADQAGDLAGSVTVLAEAANLIQAVDGTNVQVGTDARVNTTTGTPTYTLVTFGEDLGIVNPTIVSIVPDNGPKGGGTLVTITGTGFAAGATVTFDGDAATNVTVNGTTEITCRTPAHAPGAVDVVVTNTDTGTVTSSNGFTYNQNNAPAGGGGGNGGGRGRGNGGGSGGPGGGLGGGGRDKGAFRKMRWRL